MSQYELLLGDVALPAWCRIVREPALYLQHPKVTIREPEDAFALIAPKLANEEQEVFAVLTLDTQSQVLNLWQITRGLVNATLIHPREVFRPAIADNATGIIVAHNHPSGDTTPSAEDRAVTRTLVAAGRLMDIPVHDHVIVAGDRFLSFATAGLM